MVLANNSNPALLVAAIAGAVTAAGWFINYLLTGRTERRRRQADASAELDRRQAAAEAELERRRAEALLEHTERQLEELYGPLAFLVIEGHGTFRDLLDSLGRDYVFTEGEALPENELETWLFWVDNDLMPRNEQIKQILTAKTHLIEGSEMPEAFIAFLDHCNGWKIRHLRWQKEQVRYSWSSNTSYPNHFDALVLSTFQGLKKRHAKILGETLRAEPLEPSAGLESSRRA